MEFDLFLIKDFETEKGSNVKKYLGDVIGTVNLPTMPAIYSEYLQKLKRPEPKEEKPKENMKQVKQFCEDNNITIEEYRKMEKAQQERNELVASCKNGMIIFKKKKYKIESIDIKKDGKKRLLNVSEGV